MQSYKSTRLPFILLLTLLVSYACTNEQNNPFLVQTNSVGLLNKTTKISELKNIFKNDSIVESAYIGELRYASKERYRIIDVEGNPLLEITPTKDSIKTVNNVNILSKQYHTKKGIGLSSTFKDLKKNYEINEIQNTFKNIVININSINAYFTIDKIHLDYKFRNNIEFDVTEDDIPDDAPIKYFMIGWN